MSELNRDHARALLLSSAVTVVLAIVLATTVIDWDRVRTWLPSSEPTPVDHTELIASAQAYIKTLPAYDAELAPAIVFDRITPANSGVSLVEFMASAGGDKQGYRYIIYAQDGRLIGHEVQTIALNQRFTVIEPEPGAIRSRNDVLVRGSTMEPNTEVIITLRDEQNTVEYTSSTVISDAQGAFAYLVEPNRALNGRYLVSVVADDVELLIPVIIDAQSNYGFSN